MAAPWSKQLDAHLPPLAFRVHISVIICTFSGGRNGVSAGFFGVAAVFHNHKFHSTISSHSSHLLISSYLLLRWCFRRDHPASLLFIPYRMRMTRDVVAVFTVFPMYTHTCPCEFQSVIPFSPQIALHFAALHTVDGSKMSALFFS